MSKPKDYSWMTKDKLMLYTFIALAILTGISTLSFSYTPIIIAVISVGIAVLIDFGLSKLASDSKLNIMSAAVFGLIVTNSYSLGLPTLGAAATYPLNATMQGNGLYFYPALITIVGMVLFKKALNSKGRKYVNPAATAKLIILVFLFAIALTPVEHTSMIPNLNSALSLNTGPSGSMVPPFGLAVQQCFSQDFTAFNADLSFKTISDTDYLQTMTILKYHGWIGGVSAIAVLAVGIALFAILRRYVKWRITLAYLVTIAVVAVIMAFGYGDTDMLLRPAFQLFIGSSIFLAFFMATDPASTPLTYNGQLLFGVGLGVLSVLIVTYMNGFFGGSILALVVMNLTSPFLDRFGKLKPTTESHEPKLPKAMPQTTVNTYDCMRCGACMRVCCHKLSPILIKQAFDKMDVVTLSKLNADYCTGCGHCSYVCPSRIDLKGAVLRSKAMLRQEQQ